jgi:hypothetical protein
MLLSVQKFEIGALGIQRHLWSISAPGLWIHILSLRAIGQNENLVPALGFGRPRETRNSVGLSVAGRCFIRYEPATAVECVAGEVAVFPGRSSFRSAVAASDEATVSMHIETDRTLYPARPFAPSFGRLGMIDQVRADIERLCRAIEHAWEFRDAAPRVDDALTGLFARLRASGVPVPPRDAWLGARFTPQVHRSGRAVDLALSQTDCRPMLVDVERFGGISARSVERVFPELCAAWGQRPESFRAYTKRACLVRACGAMTNAKATTERVARAMGFSSPNAFCRAMARAGLPSPGAVGRIGPELG